MSMAIPTYSSQAALQAADAALTSKGRSFHWARRLLGPVHAARATRLYGICRHIDDLADEAVSIEQALLALSAFSLGLRTGISSDPVVLDAVSLLKECQIDPDILQELVNGVSSDLGLVRIRDEDALIRYCYQVAGTVGLMMCGVLDVKNPDAFAHAVDLGIAMQLTNICRDVKEDAQNGRRYLPGPDTGDLEPDALIDPGHASDSKETFGRARASVIHLLALADVYYRSGEDGLAYLPPGARSAILVASRVYRGIGAELARRNHDCWSQRAKVSTLGKARLTAHALLTYPFQMSFWRPMRVHTPQLHHALIGLPGITATDQKARHG
jgi:15-cis-phytoene synthase